MLNNIFENKFIAMENKLDALNEKLLNITSGITPVIIISEIGVATGGSNNTIIDTTKNYETNILANKIINVEVDDITYTRTILSNTVNTITINVLPGASAIAKIGTAETSEVTITVTAKGVAGNEYTVEVVEAPGTDDNLSASLTEDMLTVYLGKTAGSLDNAKNTGTLVAGVITQLAEFTAELTGSGGVVDATLAPIEFTGGVDVISVSSGDKYTR